MEEHFCNLSRDDYNRLVQETQEMAIAFGLEHRVRGLPIDEEWRIDAYFEVFWDNWQILGEERFAMTEKCSRSFDVGARDRIFAQAASELA